MAQTPLPLPQYLEFRGEYVRSKHTSYEAWAAAFEGTAGGIRKFLNEELTKINPEAIGWSRRWKNEHPNHLMLLHFNGEGRQVTTQVAVQKRYFPGHWVYLKATRLETDLTASATTARLGDVSLFRTEFYRFRNDDGTFTSFPTQALLVPTNADGTRRWTEGEFVSLETVDRRSRTVTWNRGLFGTSARAHLARDTVVLPLAGDVWGGQVLWFYNVADQAPRNPAGLNAGQVLATELAEEFAPGGRLSHLDGLAGDVNYWQARPEWDVDNDGIPDGGMVGGRNVWKAGDIAFQKLVRQALGEGRIYTSDAGTERSQQAVGLLNGFESEGLVAPNDGWRGLSSTINTHLYWQTFGRADRSLRYIVPKLNHPDDAARAPQLRRLAWGTACVLGAWITVVPEAYLPDGLSGKPGFLGQPRGPVSRPFDTPDRRLVVGEVRALAGTLEAGSTGWKARPNDGNLVLEASFPQVPAGDFTVYWEMSTTIPQEFPLKVTASTSLEPTVFGLYGSHLFVNAFTWHGHPGGAVTVRWEFTGEAPVVLGNLRAVPGADVLVRSFEHGVVAINPGLSPVTWESGERLLLPPLDLFIGPSLHQ